MSLFALTSAGPHLFWITSRAAGIVALVLSSVSVSVGLVMGLRLMRRRSVDLLALHEILSLSTLGAILIHIVALLGDNYMHPSVVDLAVPFVSGYETLWTTLGIIAWWALVLLGVSYYSRRRIGAARWRKLHRLTALAWIAGLVHSVGEGSDAGQIWFLAMTVIAAAPAVLLLGLRYFTEEAPAESPAEVGAPRPPRVAA